jgi:high-affinity nickel-transport protein
MVDVWAFVVLSIPTMIILGLRHALDVDHITAIDSLVRLHVTRKRSKWIGTGFGTGHTLSVLFEMILIIAILGSIAGTGPLVFWGGLIGISSLGMIGIINIYSMKKWNKTSSTILAGKVLIKTGILGPFKSSLLTGIVFGLGFDTATQISAITLSAVASITLGVETPLLLAGFFAVGMISLDTLDSIALRSAFSKIFHKNMFRHMSYALSGVAILVAIAMLYESLTSTPILPEWTGPSIAGGVILASFAYSFLTHA